MSMNNQARTSYTSGRDAAQARRRALSQAGKADTQVSSIAVSGQVNAVHTMVCNEAPCLMTSQVNGRELALQHRRQAALHGKIADHKDDARKQRAAARKGGAQASVPSSLSPAVMQRREQALGRKQASLVVAQPVSSAGFASAPLFASNVSGHGESNVLVVPQVRQAQRAPASSSTAELRKAQALARKTGMVNSQDSLSVKPVVGVQESVDSFVSAPVAEAVVVEERVSSRQLRQEAAARKASAQSATALRAQRRQAMEARVVVDSVLPDCGCAFSAVSAAVSAEVVPVNPLSLTGGARAFAMARRSAMSSKGKTGAQVVKTAATLVGCGLISSQAVGDVLANGLNGRQVAMARRAQLASQGGRAQSVTARPSGKQRPAVAKGEAVAKVEESETLKGSVVTGNLVDRSKKVTGNEPGSLRAVTGTEYIGVEQYDQFGAKRPEAGVPKVISTQTSAANEITGGVLFADESVTGSEAGACRKVTGTEYLAADVFSQQCGIRPDTAIPKVMSVATPKGQRVSGAPIVHSSSVTGVEVGAQRAVTGTSYLSPAALSIRGRGARVRDAASFQKVGVGHTLSNDQAVTGTQVDHSENTTGSEAGVCQPVSGSQYLSVESFKSFCRDVPYVPPAKTGRAMTASGQEVTGVMVGRKSGVTGDEAGSCREITGDQYFAVGEFGKLCTISYPRKVNVETSAAAQKISGMDSEQDSKVTGDDRGACARVSGNQYVAPQSYRAFCEQEMITPPRKVGESRTFAGQSISGTSLGRAASVTGNESGLCAAVTGNGYVGAEQYGSFCSPDALAEVAERAVRRHRAGGHSMTGQQPGIGGVLTGASRGACSLPSGTPYVGQDQLAEACGVAASSENALGGFSIQSPAHAAKSRVTGTAYGNEGHRITGPINKADGRVSGTPEFRHQAVSVKPVDVLAEPPVAQTEQRERITGEGRQAGRAITGDDWQRSGRITGTEGLSAQARNLTLKGDARNAWSMNAMQQRDVDRPEAPVTRITGSAGATLKGPVVTLSGGARG